MGKIETIQALLVMMKASGISLDELNAFCSNQPEQPSVQVKLPLEILYKGGYRSFCFEADKTPIAIIVEDIGIAFEDAPKRMNWKEAKSYCKNYSLDGKKWSLSDKDAGHFKVLYKNKAAINEVLQAFGKELLKDGWYWSSTEISDNYAWILDFSDGFVTHYRKHSTGYVRPICIL